MSTEIEPYSPSSTLPPELIEPIINETISVELLASLCSVSRACARIARKHLYKELLLINDPQYIPLFMPGRKLSFDAREQRLHTMLTNSHLWPYIRALSLSIDDPTCQDQSFLGSLTSTEILERIEIPNIDHIFLQIGRNRAMSKYPGHFRIVDPLRGELQGLLASPSMKSFSIDLFTTYSSNSPFPGWIFRSLSDTVKDVELSVRFAGWADGEHFRIPPIVPTGFPVTIAGLEKSEPKRVLERFSLIVHNNDETMAHCVAILSGLCFNFSFFQMKKLEISHIDNDAGMWILPDLSAGTLEELTILNFPNRNPFLWDNHFSAYRNLRSISFQIFFNPLHCYNTCQSLIDLFKQPLPSTLQSVWITIDLGEHLGRYNVPQPFDPRSPDFVDLDCWRDLSQTISESHIRALTIRLTWSVELCTTSIWTHDDVEIWRTDVRFLIAKWKEVFWSVQRSARCDLDLRVKIR